MNKKRRALEDHHRAGKTLQSPANRLLNLTDLSWPDDLLPDLLWLELICAECEFEKASRLMELIGESGHDASTWLCMSSAFTDVTNVQVSAISERLRADALFEDFRSAIRPLVANYERCGLNVFFDEPPKPESGDLETIRESISRMINRWGARATLIQGLAIRIAIAQGKLHFPSSSSLSEIPKLWTDPESEDARKAGAAARATLSSMLSQPSGTRIRKWCDAFWSQGRILAECRFPDPNE